MTRIQYRIIVNESTSKILDALPSAQWTHATDVTEERGGVAQLQRRFVFEDGYVEKWAIDNPAGWLQLKDKTITPWEIFAEVDGG